mmetsp:Transcript_37415/g.106127  ORF Transcript_37415/g.106127 Transcript_37415/m.106127 type:complete len:506 (+) Transcript_37415:1456-2973(+)
MLFLLLVMLQLLPLKQGPRWFACAVRLGSLRGRPLDADRQTALQRDSWRCVLLFPGTAEPELFRGRASAAGCRKPRLQPRGTPHEGGAPLMLFPRRAHGRVGKCVGGLIAFVGAAQRRRLRARAALLRILGLRAVRPRQLRGAAAGRAAADLGHRSLALHGERQLLHAVRGAVRRPQLVEGAELREDREVHAESEEGGKRHVPEVPLGHAVGHRLRPVLVEVSQEEPLQDRAVLEADVDAPGLKQHVADVVVQGKLLLEAVEAILRRAVHGKHLGPLRDPRGPIAHRALKHLGRRAEFAQHRRPEIIARSEVGGLREFVLHRRNLLLLLQRPPTLAHHALGDAIRLIEALLELSPRSDARQPALTEQLGDQRGALVDGGEGQRTWKRALRAHGGVAADERVEEAHGMVVGQASLRDVLDVDGHEAAVQQESAEGRPEDDVHGLTTGTTSKRTIIRTNCQRVSVRKSRSRFHVREGRHRRRRPRLGDHGAGAHREERRLVVISDRR